MVINIQIFASICLIRSRAHFHGQCQVVILKTPCVLLRVLLVHLFPLKFNTTWNLPFNTTYYIFLLAWASKTVWIRGTLQKVPFYASALYGWRLHRFEWNFLPKTDMPPSVAMVADIRIADSEKLVTAKTKSVKVSWKFVYTSKAQVLNLRMIGLILPPLGFSLLY